MEFSFATAGYFRANQYASDYNNIRLVDDENKGTPAKDEGTVATGLGVNFDGVEYAGKDGVVQFLQFDLQQFPDANKTPIKVPVDAGRAALQKAIQTILDRHEVDPVIKVTGSAANFVVTHYGAGMLSGVYMDGAKTAVSRTAL